MDNYSFCVKKYNEIYDNLVKNESGELFIYHSSDELINVINDCKKFPKLKKSGEGVVVSLTSIPSRFGYLQYAIKSLFLQSFLPDRIILWLDKTMEKNEYFFSKEIYELTELGLEIRFVTDIGPHTKYYYVLQECDSQCVVTVDDDILYQLDLLELLWEAHLSNSSDICTIKPLNIKFTANGIPYPLAFCEEAKECDNKNLFAQGVCGVLYPPKCFDKRCFDEKLIRKLSLKQDDIWLWFWECITDKKVVAVNSDNRLYCVMEKTQEIALLYHNQKYGNDRYFKQLLEHFELQNKFLNRSKNENHDKKIIILTWLQLLQHNRRLADYLHRKGNDNVSIYGYGEIGSMLVDELVSDGITITHIIDKNTNIKTSYKISSPDCINDVQNLLIYTVPVKSDFFKINKKINAISLLDILVEMRYEGI